MVKALAGDVATNTDSEEKRSSDAALNLVIVFISKSESHIVFLVEISLVKELNYHWLLHQFLAELKR